MRGWGESQITTAYARAQIAKKEKLHNSARAQGIEASLGPFAGLTLFRSLPSTLISIETKRCCDCGKTLNHKLDQFAVNEKQVMCSDCWDGSKTNPRSNSANGPICTLVHLSDKD